MCAQTLILILLTFLSSVLQSSTSFQLSFLLYRTTVPFSLLPTVFATFPLSYVWLCSSFQFCYMVLVYQCYFFLWLSVHIFLMFHFLEFFRELVYIQRPYLGSSLEFWTLFAAFLLTRLVCFPNGCASSWLVMNWSQSILLLSKVSHPQCSAANDITVISSI